MNLQQLRYVVEVADSGTMTTAAARLNVSQPALSRAVRELERELDAVLFERQGRNVALTPVAADVVDAARRALAAVEDVRRAASPSDRPPLVIASTSTVAAVFVDRVMASVVDHPIDRHIRFIHTDSPDQVELLVLRGEAEFGLIDRVPAGALAHTCFASEATVLVAPASFQLPDPLRFEALDGMPLILPSSGSPRRRETDAFMSNLGIRPVVALETDDRSSWTRAVLAGVGAALWYETLARDAARCGAQMRSFDPPFFRTLHLVHRSGQLSTPGRALLSIVEQLDPDVAAVEGRH